MIVIASSNGRIGIEAATEILRQGGTAVDAVEVGIRLVELNPEDHTVGFNGYPNILGEVELDASIMNGRTLESGAVGAMTGYVHAISVARQVMARLPHVLLVGDGANRFAAEIGQPQQAEMLLPEIREVWASRLRHDMDDADIAQIGNQTNLSRWVELATDPERAKGTVNFIAQDKNGDICTGVSTSGWAWKYPGRLGDSPIIGAGNYADNRFGAAACTGMGEMAIRACTAHSMVFYMKMGLSVAEASTRAFVDLRDLDGRYISVMNTIALDKDGNHAGYSSENGRTYIYQAPDMSACEEIGRTVVPVPPRWG
ncbi:N4-(beta-N-acetylglucosaminyl)-L-asparaginase, putative [hydrothermal vent metagenome]|uniref:N4-(Beta-N-acetylglucosaminyl)-L-asparaginase, putative n=1 Tax=hydrothermal vent metagenome TaxID=652676 RepID=A0A3B0VID6_9ZZZZ